MNSMDRGPLVRGSRESVCATRLKSFAQRVTIFTLTSLTVSGLVAPLAMAQVARAPISPEAMAVHLLAKRPLSFATAKPEVSSASDSGINSAQGFGALARDLGHPAATCFLRLRISARM